MGWDRKKRPFRVFGLRASSGITVDTGGITITGGLLTLTSGTVKFPLLAAVSTATTLTNYGVSRLSGTSAKNYTLAPPALGHLKIITAGSTLAMTVQCTTGTYFQASTHADGAGASTAIDQATFNDGTDSLVLLGLSTVAWHVIANTGTVALA